MNLLPWTKQRSHGKKKSNERLWNFNLNNSTQHLVDSHDMHFATYDIGKKTNDSTYSNYHGEGNLEQQPNTLLKWRKP
jgi:hypothetical protein